MRTLWVLMPRPQEAYRYTPSTLLIHVRANLVPGGVGGVRSLTLLVDLGLVTCVAFRYMGCAARENLDTNFLVACAPSKQTRPF